jgi:WD40 repeat protein
VTEALDQVGTAYRDGGWPAPYHAAWAAAKPQAELVVLRGHDGYVNAVCTMPAGGRTLLASAGDDRRVRLWDPQTGTRTATVPTHYAALAVTGVADSLAIGLDAGVLVISLDPSLHASTPGREHPVIALAHSPCSPRNRPRRTVIRPREHGAL